MDTEAERSNSVGGEKPTVQHNTVTETEGNKLNDRAETSHIDHHKPTVEEMEGSGGLKGLLANPFVFATAVFASLGGLLFGCKFVLMHYLSWLVCMHTYHGFAYVDIQMIKESFLGCWLCL
jgi:hypothetical protein